MKKDYQASESLPQDAGVLDCGSLPCRSLWAKAGPLPLSTTHTFPKRRKTGAFQNLPPDATSTPTIITSHSGIPPLTRPADAVHTDAGDPASFLRTGHGVRSASFYCPVSFAGKNQTWSSPLNGIQGSSNLSKPIQGNPGQSRVAQTFPRKMAMPRAVQKSKQSGRNQAESNRF